AEAWRWRQRASAAWPGFGPGPRSGAACPQPLPPHGAPVRALGVRTNPARTLAIQRAMVEPRRAAQGACARVRAGARQGLTPSMEAGDGGDENLHGRLPLRARAVRGDNRSKSGHRLQLLDLRQTRVVVDVRAAAKIQAAIGAGRSRRPSI